MRQAHALSGILMGTAAAFWATQPVWAAATQVTGVRLNPNGNELQLVLETQAGGDRPQVFTVSRGNDLLADIVNAKLNLPDGSSFRQENPMPGIASIAVNPLDANSIRVTVSGAGSSPIGQILQNEEQGITLGISTNAGNKAADPTPVTPPPNTSASSGTPILSAPSTPTPLAQAPNSPTPQAQTPTPTSPTPEPPAAQPIVPTPTPEVLFPNPRITIDGVPAAPAGPAQPVAPAPPFLPRAIAPPVGDIAISSINASASSIDLGTAVRVPRLVLREAPVREVLALLARSAGLNLAFTGEGAPGAEGQPGTPGPGGPGGPTISLDIENEPVQDVFNYVLQLSGLQANRIGRTIFVGTQLPSGARNLITRTLRLNQVSAAQAAAFLSAQGAETQRVVEEVTIQTVGEGAAARTVETRNTTIQPLAATVGQGPLLLRGLSVLTDERLNAVSLVGEPRQIEIASAFLTQLDLRRRQVAVNVKIVDVNLSGTDVFNTSFSFGIGDGFFTVDQGAARFNYGETRPPTAGELDASLGSPTIIGNPYAGANTFIDFDRSVNVPGTGVGRRTIINNQVTGQSSITEVPGGELQFFERVAGLRGDPFRTGVTDVTLGTPDIITTTTTPGTPAIPATFNPVTGELLTPGTPGSAPITTTTITPGTRGTVTSALPQLFQFPKRFLAALRAQIVSGNAKILTDPTLVVQEGQTATVNLTQEVVTNVERTREGTGDDATTTIEFEKGEAGLILEIVVSRIDDNGFITLAVNPRVSSIGGEQDLSTDDDVNRISLLNVRQLASGQIRLRDGQTLILSGIIQESDRTTVNKVPILGDIPILGALFRSTNRTNQRQEVIVLLTPQILDDSAGSSFGYNYTPGRETEQFLERRGFSTQGN